MSSAAFGAQITFSVLFDTMPGMKNDQANLLPEDGHLFYLEQFISSPEKEDIFEKLKAEVEWQSEKIKIFGREVLQPRLTAWYGDAGMSYTYSGLLMQPKPWTPLLLKLKQKVEKKTETSFNSVLLNYYRSGDDYVSWHADNERELGENPVIASLSFGCERRFQLRHRVKKDLETITLNLGPGSLVVMSGSVQKCWLHRIAPTKKMVGERINLTFRTII